MGWFDGFPGGLHDADGTTLFARVGGNPDGPPLLLHGYPRTHAMWRRVATKLAPHFRIFLAEELPDETAALLSGHLLH